MSREVRWISFDDTVSVPTLRGLEMTEASLRTLFEHSNADQNEIRWDDEGCSICYVGDGLGWNDEEAERVLKTEVDGVELYSFTTAPYQFNYDTEDMRELGYTAEWVPGTGFVVTAPETTAETAAQRIIDSISSMWGRYIPERANSWTEFAAASHNLELDFFYAGLNKDETEKQAKVAEIVGDFLHELAAHQAVSDDLLGVETATAAELTIGDTVEGKDVRWHGSTPYREVYAVVRTMIGPGPCVIAFRLGSGLTRTLTVTPDRRFRKA